MHLCSARNRRTTNALDDDDEDDDDNDDVLTLPIICSMSMTSRLSLWKISSFSKPILPQHTN